MRYLFILLLSFNFLWADFEYGVDNTNITVSSAGVAYNYDRLRLRTDYTSGDFFLTCIGDGINYYGHEYINSNEFKFIQQQKSDTPFKTQTSFHNYDNGSSYARLYRLYGGYEDSKNRVVVGLQNITMGVGRIWNPTNLFNPKNVYRIEPYEVFGVAAISYTRYLSDTSHLSIVASQRADHSFKYAGQYKAFVKFADIGVDILSSNETTMLGYEIEGNIADTGIEFRSEGAYIKSSLNTSLTQTQDKDFFQGIIGADYGFVNGITLVAEALYSSKSFSYMDILLNINSEISPNLVNSNLYTALYMSYSFNIFLDGSLVYIESFDDENSRFIAPTITYTLNDYNSFNLGAMIQDGTSQDELNIYENRYFFEYRLVF